MLISLGWLEWQNTVHCQWVLATHHFLFESFFFNVCNELNITKTHAVLINITKLELFILYIQVNLNTCNISNTQTLWDFFPHQVWSVCLDLSFFCFVFLQWTLTPAGDWGLWAVGNCGVSVLSGLFYSGSLLWISGRWIWQAWTSDSFLLSMI